MRNKQGRGIDSERWGGLGKKEKKHAVISVAQTNRGSMERMKEQLERRGWVCGDYAADNRFFIARGVAALSIPPTTPTTSSRLLSAPCCQLGLDLPTQISSHTDVSKKCPQHIQTND